MLKPILSFTHLKAILTQNIQTTFSIQITFVLEVTKHKSLYIQLTFNQNQFYKINSTKINFFHDTTKHTISNLELRPVHNIVLVATSTKLLVPTPNKKMLTRNYLVG